MSTAQRYRRFAQLEAHESSAASVADLVHRAPAATTVVIFHSAVLSYLDPAARTTFVETVRALPCHSIANEGPGVLPDITHRLPVPIEQIGGRFVLSFDGRPIALAGGHGQTLGWIG
ncbi:DUF2332 family protein [Nocardia rhamnosiphila]